MQWYWWVAIGVYIVGFITALDYWSRGGEAFQGFEHEGWIALFLAVLWPPAVVLIGIGLADRWFRRLICSDTPKSNDSRQEAT